ncbi:MAG: STAS domain-containing protein [Deltaproteobacteria bacterium]|nr:STAS domain-containing protein [Deltaproteobacteria bacterium]
MSVKTTKSDDSQTLTITLNGYHFGLLDNADFGKAYEDKLGSISHVVVDMANVESIDSLAFSILLGLRGKASANKADVTLLGCNAKLRELFTTVKFDTIFKIV